MEANRTCPSCGIAVGKDAPFGQCPRCLFELAFLSIEPPPQGQGFKKSTTLKLGDYELIEQIGRGGMGVVYKARQLSLNRVVAVKMVLDSHLASPVVLRRFLIEAEAAAKLEHPHIVPIYEIAEIEGQHFFSMRFIQGDSLECKIKRGGFEIPKRAAARFQAARDKVQENIARFMATVARAVHYAHERGVLHRDLKPSNILIDEAGQPHLTDFGLAKVSDDEIRVTPKTAILGTPGYMPPEQAVGEECTAAADIYSLGAILHELLVGKPPFEGSTPLETLRRTREEEPLHPARVNRAIHPDLGTICLKCLEKEPIRRYATAEALACDLERWLGHEPIVARPAGVWLRSRRWVERNRAGTAVIGSLFAGLILTSISLKDANEERQAKEAALVSFSRAISRQIDYLGSTNSYYEITSEQFGYLVGKPPVINRGPLTRYIVGVFVSANPLETVRGYGGFFSSLEKGMSRRANQPVKLDFRIYTDPEQARQHLIAGRIHFLRTSPRQAATLHQQDNAALLGQDASDRDMAVIFSRADTGITNLAQLKGHSVIMFDEQSSVTLAAKEVLADAGLCRADLVYKNFNGVTQSVRPQTGYFESPEQGYFDRQCETVRQVLELKKYEAGVARERQFRLKHGAEWKALARFPFSPFVWLASSKTDATSVRLFEQALVRDNSSARSELRDHHGAGYEVNIIPCDVDFLPRLNRAFLREELFDHCGVENPGVSAGPPSDGEK